jgi:hypothetical protein
VDAGQHPADLFAEHPVKRVPPGKDRGNPDPQLAQRGRHLAADEPHADDNRGAAGHRLPLDGVAFGHRPQVVNPGPISPVALDPPVAAAGGDQHFLVPDRLPGIQRDRVRGGVDGHDGSVAPLDVVLGVPVGRPDIPAREVLLRPQVGLGQRRTPERHARFPAGNHDRS